MRTLVLYDDDADGFAAAYAAWLKFGSEAEYQAVDRGDEAPDTRGVDRLFVLDFNYPRDTMLLLAQRSRDIVLLDHHASAKEELYDLPFCKFDLTKSAAVIAWEYFHPEESVPMFYGYVQDADLYQWRLPMSREAHLAVESYDRDFGTWASISGILMPQRDFGVESLCLEQLIRDGTVIARFADRQIKQTLDHARCGTFIVNDEAVTKNRIITFDPDAPSDGDGIYQVPVVNASVLTSDVCHQLLNKHPQAKFAAAYHDTKHGLRKWGLRSRGDFDVSQVCKQFGGGGHKSAGGFKTFHDADYGAPVEKKHRDGAE